MSDTNNVSSISVGVLSKKELNDRLYTNNNDKKIVVTPMIDKKEQLGDFSIDVRLGCDFVVFKKTKFSALEPSDKMGKGIGEYQENVHVNFGERIFLHPREFVLGVTLEYVKLPPDIFAYITSRSTWGRLGLVIATATAIHPNYAGIITLELSNLGETPIPLNPGLRIAQLIFHQAQKKEIEKFGNYQLSIQPGFVKVFDEPEWKLFDRLKDAKKKK
jgi:dCTP deaminase